MKDFCTVTLDIAYEPPCATLFDACIDMINGAAIIPTVVNARGSGGGAPEVEFAGAMDDIMTMLVRYCGGDAEQALDLVEYVQTSDRFAWGGQA